MVSLEQDEYIVKEVRKHIYFTLLQIIGSIIAAVIPVLLVILIVNKSEITSNTANLLAAGVALYPLWLLAIWISFFYFWTDYYLSVLIVTNKRIMDIKQLALFSREVSTCPLENIQDITTDIRGAMATILDFGDVRIQTAGEKEEFVIKLAAHPESVKKIITAEHDRVLATLRSTKV